jgi:hypothetical protein
MIDGFPDGYVQAAIDGEIVNLASALEGERNNTLFKATASLASLGLREGEILRILKAPAESIGLRGSEFFATVKSGVKAGQANPRALPNDLAPRKSVAVAKPVIVFAGDGGPPRLAEENRRHVYKRDGVPVRIKIKRSMGYVNWYRVTSAGRDGWQAGKPAGYEACPYVGPVDPFDPELAADLLYWPEGEKDCDTLGSVGLPALTFGGAGDGLPDRAADFLVKRHVVILADNDTAGRDHALKKAAVAVAVAASVRIVEFPELPSKSDVTDYLGHATAEDLEQRARQVVLWTSPAEPKKRQTQRGWRKSVITASDLRVKTFAPVRYVVPGYIPEGVTVFAGKPKIGKSWLLYDVCIGCAADRFVLGAIKPTQGDVLYLALEDSQRRLKQRLEKLCPQESSPARLTLATEWRRADEGGIQDIGDWCDGASNPVLVVIDTLERIRPPAKPGPSAYATDYAAIAALHKLAHERSIAIVVIHHVRKMEADDPFDMVSGTNGLTGAADTILIIKRQAGNVTLYARGRDIEEQETACQFNKASCRWTFLGEANEVHGSGQRSAIVDAIRTAGEEGMHISEIMAAIRRTDRNAVDQLLFKMHRDGDLVRIKRATYAHPSKIGKKERSEAQAPAKTAEIINLTDLTDLTRGSHPGPRDAQ